MMGSTHHNVVLMSHISAAPVKTKGASLPIAIRGYARTIKLQTDPEEDLHDAFTCRQDAGQPGLAATTDRPRHARREPATDAARACRPRNRFADSFQIAQVREPR